MSNKARFVHKIVSGRAPMYLSTKLLINQSSRNSSRKLNVPIPRIDLFNTFCVSVLYVHVVFDDKHVLNLMCVRACIYVYPRSSCFFFLFFFSFFLFNAHYLFVSRFPGVHFNVNCMNVHVLDTL